MSKNELAKVQPENLEDLSDLAVQPNTGKVTKSQSAAIQQPEINIESPRNASPDSAISQANEGGYLAGHSAASAVAGSYQQGFAIGLQDGVKEGQEAIATFQKQCLNSLGSAFGPEA